MRIISLILFTLSCLISFAQFDYKPESEGWAQYADGQYHVGNKLVVNQGDTTKLTVNNASTITGFLPAGVDSLWDSVNNKLILDELGGHYTVRTIFKSSTSATNGGYGSVQLDIGGAQGIILEDVITFPKGKDVAHAINNTSTVYALNTFIANGGEISFYSGHGNTSIWDITLVIFKP